jgi:hypothetical protein
VGGGTRYRKGFTTTNKTKIAVCSKFKALIENRRLNVASKNLISEMKTFVAHGTSYAAKPGETDDLVMSMMLAVRMIQLLQEFDARLDQKMRDGLEDYIEPMPFIMI